MKNSSFESESLDYLSSRRQVCVSRENTRRLCSTACLDVICAHGTRHPMQSPLTVQLPKTSSQGVDKTKDLASLTGSASWPNLRGMQIKKQWTAAERLRRSVPMLAEMNDKLRAWGRRLLDYGEHGVLHVVYMNTMSHKLTPVATPLQFCDKSFALDNGRDSLPMNFRRLVSEKTIGGIEGNMMKDSKGNYIKKTQLHFSLAGRVFPVTNPTPAHDKH